MATSKCRTGRPGVEIGRRYVRICGHEYPNWVYLPARFSGGLVSSGFCQARPIARHLRRLGIEALRAFDECSEVIIPTFPETFVKGLKS